MSSSRKQSIVEAAEKTFDKNTLILIVNVIILAVLISMLYMVATAFSKLFNNFLFTGTMAGNEMYIRHSKDHLRLFAAHWAAEVSRRRADTAFVSVADVVFGESASESSVLHRLLSDDASQRHAQ
ncbi:unnamed protein product [Caenorhabditis auriculariae]|uniref:Uncharacterized protein n=1 Tax=Caenorhabditis auriculariae TaxID=2777116 RepID=A0A8S1HCE9_9PELO|nr:unnamed protein product [Caenorhabditis auriculariae]